MSSASRSAGEKRQRGAELRRIVDGGGKRQRDGQRENGATPTGRAGGERSPKDQEWRHVHRVEEGLFAVNQMQQQLTGQRRAEDESDARILPRRQQTDECRNEEG